MSPLFIPGPVFVEEEVMNEMTLPIIGHRSKEFQDLYKEIKEFT